MQSTRTFKAAFTCRWAPSDGEQGVGIKSMLSLFAISDKRKVSAYGDISGWTETLPTATEQKPYLWQCVKTTYTTGDEEYSTPVLMATYSAAANANLLENASFVSSKRMSAWQTQSVYQVVTGQTAPDTSADGHGISTTEQVEGRNSYYDVCEATSDVVQYKNVLQQKVATSKLAKGAWHTMSFWAKKGSIFTGSVGTTGVSYTVSLTAGTTYTFTMTGMRTLAAQKNGSTLILSLSTTSGLVQGSVGIATTSYKTVLLEVTPTASGDYVLKAGMSEGTATSIDTGSSSALPSTGTISELWMSPEQDLQTYLYSKAIVDTTAKIYMDGVELAPNTDLGLTWALSTSWTKHTLTFKTKSSLSGNTNVLFRLPPCLATDASRKVWICMPKLETGFFATAFIDSAADAKGEDGDAGIAGQIVRTSEWTAGVTYHNDTEPTDDGIRWLDVVTVTENGVLNGVWQCVKTHVARAEDDTDKGNKPPNISSIDGTVWKSLNVLSPIYTPMIMAKNAVLRVAQSNRIAIMDTNGTAVQGCLTGVSNETDYMMWIGGTAASAAKFKVKYDGTMEATSGSFTGSVMAQTVGYKMAPTLYINTGDAPEYQISSREFGWVLDKTYSVFSVTPRNTAADSDTWLLGLPLPKNAEGSVVEIFINGAGRYSASDVPSDLILTCYDEDIKTGSIYPSAGDEGTAGEHWLAYLDQGDIFQGYTDYACGHGGNGLSLNNGKYNASESRTNNCYLSWIRLFCDGTHWRVAQYTNP
jgi:hypothetical protein